VLINFFLTLRRYSVPTTLRELLDLVAAMKAGVVHADMDDFYLLARTCLVKNEQHYDRFDRSFAAFFKGLENLDGLFGSMIPDEWLRREFENSLTPEELASIDSIGGLEKLIEAFQEKQEAPAIRDPDNDNNPHGQQGEERGNNRKGPKGKGGQGAGGRKSRERTWRQRRFKDLDDSVELGTRNIKMALRRLRKLARTGREDELDMPSTIRSTAHNGGLLDIKMRPTRRNTVKVLCFFDIGGSMDAHVEVCEALFSAASNEFKYMKHFYFHNFIYESVWQNNKRRRAAQIPTASILNKYAGDYKVVFVGDATMAPYEITHVGGSVEHWNEEPGALWMKRLRAVYNGLIWINPTPADAWDYSSSVEITRSLVDDKMYPLTVRGIEEGMQHLSR